jgi:heme/copper-type cytochrome/quinol oxidase subunit 4
MYVFLFTQENHSMQFDANLIFLIVVVILIVGLTIWTFDKAKKPSTVVDVG